MNFDFREIATVSTILFAVIDIIGSLPIIIELRKKAGEIHSLKTTLVSCGIMVVFLFIGESILKLIGIDVNSFAVAGAIVLFFLALEMILGIKIYKDEIPATTSIVPLAFPIIAGAGTMTTLLSLKSEFATENIIVAILLNSIIVLIVLNLTGRLERWLGPSGIAILRKVFGIVLMALAIKLFTKNIGLLFPVQL